MAWLSLFKFSWLRKCKVCGVRGGKCVCKRPSLALEHIFFLEERKNKYGARNFSHVSDTMVTSTTSTVLTANNTVLMRGSLGDEFRFTDYYYNPSYPPNAPSTINSNQQQPPLSQSTLSSSTSSSLSNQTLRSAQQQHNQNNKKGATPTSTSQSTALVTKNTGAMILRKASSFRSQSSNDYIDVNSQQYRYSRKRSRGHQNSVTTLTTARINSRANSAIRKEEGCSFQFYGRGGTGTNSNMYSQTNRTMSDSLVRRSSNASSIRMSHSSDCSVENNYGSYNPRGYFDSFGPAVIQEDEDALDQLHGWFQNSPTSTDGSLAMSRLNGY